MDSESVLQALLDVWDELPSLLGAAWAELYPELERLLARLQASDDPGEQASLIGDIILLLRPYPAVRQRLQERTQTAGHDRQSAARLGETVDEAITTTRAPALSVLLAGLQQRLHPPFVTRYTDITAPRRMALGRRGVITVGLTRAPAPDSEKVQPLEVQLRQFLEVYLQSRPQDFEIIGEPVKYLPVEAERDSEPVVFYVKSLSLGRKSLLLDFRQSGIIIGTVRLVIEVSKETPAEEQLQALAGAIFTGGPYTPPPDLDIRVTTRTQNGQTVLDYVLHSPSGAAAFHYQCIPGPAIQGSPQQFQTELMRKIEDLAERRDTDGLSLTPGQVEDKLVAIGQGLYYGLFSKEMRDAYRCFREKVHTVQITSDEPWIPWELIKPYEDDFDDDFLCARFELTRWLAGQGGPAGKIEVSRLACVAAANAPGEKSLEYASQERQYLAGLARAYGVEDVSPETATGQAVAALLDAGGIGLWHFAAHGNFDVRRSDESVIRLADGRGLRAEDIHGQRQSHISHDRPLVFLNACQVGRLGFNLTRLGGWAAALVDRCRCGAFIGPLWSVDDRLAYEFVRTFYDALRDEKTIGQAAQAARQHIRQLVPDNPTWLAYSVYAQPNARLTWSRAMCRGSG